MNNITLSIHHAYVTTNLTTGVPEHASIVYMILFGISTILFSNTKCFYIYHCHPTKNNKIVVTVMIVITRTTVGWINIYIFKFILALVIE